MEIDAFIQMMYDVIFLAMTKNIIANKYFHYKQFISDPSL